MPDPTKDNQERKLRSFARLAKRFLKASAELLYATEQLRKYDSGTRGWDRAVAIVQRRDKTYDAIARQLNDCIGGYL